MTKIGFIGLGNMGLPMAQNLSKAGFTVIGYDIAEPARQRAAAAGLRMGEAIDATVREAEFVITMLPAGPQVREVYLSPGGVLDNAQDGALLIDCSTIDVETARAVHAEAKSRGFDMLDAPVSGGVAGAEAATLTFMVGGDEAAFARAEPILAKMGRAVIYAGPAGNGQAAKICNNMMLGVQMLSVCEAFVLAEKLGLAADKLYEIASRSSGQCWSLTSYCPVPGLVPTAPSNRGYQPGFTAAMMVKDLRLAQEAASRVGAPTLLGAEAFQLYTLYNALGYGGRDFSGIIEMIAGKKN